MAKEQYSQWQWLNQRIRKTLWYKYKKIRWAVKGDAEKNRVLVAGSQRSGTNMLMGIFDRSADADVYHESDRRAFDDFQMRDITVIKQLTKESKAPFFVIKSLCELDKLPSLAEDLAPAKIIWIYRHYSDMVNSGRVRFQSLPAAVARMVKRTQLDDWRVRGVTDGIHDKLVEHMVDGATDNTAIALFWYARNQLFFELGLDKNPDVLLVNYERLVQDPSREVKRVFDFVRVDYNPGVHAQVFATSIGKSPAPSEVSPSAKALCDDLFATFEEALHDAQ